MNYKETLDYMYAKLPMYQRIGKAAYKADIKTSVDFDNYLHNPHKNYKTIHIGGTNGKGSVSHILASVLQENGFNVGLYTSPHLKSFRERIKINGKCIEKNYIVDFIEKNKTFIEKNNPSFFEITVFMAFQYFKDKKVDIAIIEVGMGGRLDSTNVIIPELSVITNISYDHTYFLGDTLEKIAIEKAGIIKEKIPVVIGETQKETKKVFMDFAKNQQAEIFFADNCYKIEYSLHNSYQYQIFNIKQEETIVYKNLKLDLAGKYQEKNLITTLCALDILNKKGFKVSKESIYSACLNVVENTNFKGRWQILEYNPMVICDTAHNVAGIKSVVEQIKMIPYKTLYFVLGTVDDKNIDEILKLLPKDAKYYFTQAKIPRALKVDVLQKKAEKFNLKGEIFNTVEKAYSAAKQQAEKNDLVFIGGSTFVVAEVL